jgi:4-carboxymuconolactone decarboxylase
MAMTPKATLKDDVRQIVILAVGARFNAANEIYAHIAVAEREGMKPERLASLSRRREAERSDERRERCLRSRL